jgi:hypothetical protein
MTPSFSTDFIPDEFIKTTDWDVLLQFQGSINKLINCFGEKDSKVYKIVVFALGMVLSEWHRLI